jgi:hypothetical protein
MTRRRAVTTIVGAVVAAVVLAGGMAAAQDQNGEQLRRAAAAGNLAEVQRLISSGAPLESRDGQGAARCSSPSTATTSRSRGRSYTRAPA